ncbi:hypothetical protein BH23PLA1_BH23PLA1_03550 [soil metagenome]
MVTTLSPMIVLAALIFIISMAVMVGSRHASREHAGAIKPSGGGRPASDGMGWRALTCIAIGAVVPIVCFAMAVKLVMTPAPPRVDSELLLMLAFLLVVIGVGGLVSGSFLAYRLLGTRDRAGLPMTDKPPFDPETLDNVDSYDVAGRSGRSSV